MPTAWSIRNTVLLFNKIPGLFAFNTTLVLLKNIGDGFLTFTPIDWRWYLNMTASYTAFFSAVNPDAKVDVCTDVCLFDDQFFGIEPST